MTACVWLCVCVCICVQGETCVCISTALNSASTIHLFHLFFFLPTFPSFPLFWVSVSPSLSPPAAALLTCHIDSRNTPVAMITAFRKKLFSFRVTAPLKPYLQRTPRRYIKTDLSLCVLKAFVKAVWAANILFTFKLSWPTFHQHETREKIH